MARMPRIGEVGWMDLTVPDASRVRDFYEGVVGWRPEGLEMGGYHDFVMHAAGGAPVAGVCEARGVNLGLPPVWLMYITVADLDRALAQVVGLGGEVVREPGAASSYGRFAVIKDPSGAVCAIFEPAKPPSAKSSARKPAKVAKKKTSKVTKSSKPAKKARKVTKRR